MGLGMQRKLRVLWLAPYPYEQVGGESNNSSHPAPWITELAKEISSKVHLTIASFSKSTNKFVSIKKEGVQYLFCPSSSLKFDLLSLYQLRIKRLTDELKKRNTTFDVIHVHGSEHQYETVAQRLHIPYVISMQGILNLYRPVYPHKLSPIFASWLIGSVYERYGIMKSSHFICRTKFDSGYVRRLNPDAKIYTNWELIRSEFFGNNYDEKSRAVLFLGGTGHFKGFRETLQCLDIIRKRGLNMRLRICGRGEKSDISEFIKRNHLSIPLDDIEFLDFQPAHRLAAIFKDSFCLIHPSYMDNSPNSICEAQIAGLPVIASDVGGVGSLITDNETGMLVHRYDPVGLADKICSLAGDIALYRHISNQSQRIARKRHNRDQIVANTLKIYQDLSKNA